MKKITIYTVAHKNFEINRLNLDKCYKTIRVGKYGESDSAILSDRSGDSIYQKNPNYCELTALYWIWKNDKNSEYVGLCHYRRYFTKYSISRNIKGILKEKDFVDLLNKYNVLVAKKEYSYRGVYEAYLDCGFEKDLILTEEAISKLYPQYLDSYDKMVKKSAGNYPANMYVMSKKLSDQYCEWLFDVLGYVEKNCELSNYTQQEARIFGYLSERLLGVWLDYNKLNIKEIRIFNTEEKRNIKNYIIDILRDVKIYQYIKMIIYKTLIKREYKGN